MGTRAKLDLFYASLLFAVVVWQTGTVRAAEASPVWVVLSDHPSYRQASDAITQSLSEKGHDTQTLVLPAVSKEPAEPSGATSPIDEAGAPKQPSPLDTWLAQISARERKENPRLIIALGEPSSRLMLARASQTPLLCGMIPNALDLMDERASWSADRVAVVVSIDPSPDFQLRWLETLAPQARRIGVLCSDRTLQTAKALQKAGATRRLEIILVRASKDDFATAIHELSGKACDAVIMLPDSAVYNTASIRRTLLWGLRQKAVVLAFSEHIVKAGALGGTHVDYAAVGRQTAKVATDWLNKTDPKPQPIELVYLDPVRTSVNERTGRMLGLRWGTDLLEQVDLRFGVAD